MVDLEPLPLPAVLVDMELVPMLEVLVDLEPLHSVVPLED